MSFFSSQNPHLYINVFISLLNGCLLCFTGYKFLQIIQLSGYKIAGYTTWLKDTKGKYISRITMLTFLSLACMIVFNCVFDSIEHNFYVSYAGIAFYLLFSIEFIRYMFNAPKKTPLKITYRMNRYITILFLFSAGMTFGLITIFTLYVPHVRYAIVGFTPIFLPLLVPIVHFILFPLENLNRLRFIQRAKRKLGKNPTLIKIGITGSYGKTSTKYILNTILSTKFNVCISPHSFNTPMGLTKVVLDYLKPEHEILIAEMGARHVGDIAYLSSIIHPQYAILTSIGNQHLESFGTVENIMKTKNELIRSLPIYGFAVFNGDDEICMELQKDCTCGSVFTSLINENAYAYAKDIEISAQGLEFTLVIMKKELRCRTKLLGEHNLTNILLCSALAFKLGLTLKEIQRGIRSLKPIAHRLELIKVGDMKILDDSYNSNSKGCEAALKVLDLFEGGNKIVITPGLIELGQKEFEINKQFGINMSKVANYVIIVNEINKEAIIEGLLEGGFNEENIFIEPTLDHARLKLKDITNPNDVILFENDLPDNYT